MIHLFFDLLAMTCAAGTSWWFSKRYVSGTNTQLPSPQKQYYLASLLLGLVIGGLLFGTLNLYLSGKMGIAKSMLGGIFGAIIAAETFKVFAGIRRSTGLVFIPGLIVLIVVGRVGCYMAGLQDFTYGIPTTVAWAVDFGDGVLRHPVQLYESLALLLFLVFFLLHYPRHQPIWQRQGFYVFILFYASQRFVWEFFKPYADILLSLNLFHWITLLLIGYALFMACWSQRNDA
ncbi:MAG: prolipoprotein diacylglyceryl transferase family protein [Leucothrix sp.]